MVLRPEKGRDVAFTIMHSVNSGIKGSNHYSFVSLCPGVMYLLSVGTTRLLQAVSDKPLSDSNRHFVSTIKKTHHTTIKGLDTLQLGYFGISIIHQILFFPFLL